MGLLPTMRTDRLHWVPKTATTSEDYLPSRSSGNSFLYDTPSCSHIIKKETNVFRTFSLHFYNVNPNFVGHQRRLVGLRPSEFVVPNSFALTVCCFTDRTLIHIKFSSSICCTVVSCPIRRTYRSCHDRFGLPCRIGRPGFVGVMRMLNIFRCCAPCKITDTVV